MVVLPLDQSGEPGTALSLSQLVRRLRQERRLTQEELAERCGISVRSVRNLELGRVLSPRPDTVEQLGAALELGPDERRELDAAAGRPEARRRRRAPRAAGSTAAERVSGPRQLGGDGSVVLRLVGDDRDALDRALCVNGRVIVILVVDPS